MEDEPVFDDVPSEPPELDERARLLLSQSVQLSNDEFAAVLAVSASRKQLESFIRHARVMDSDIWKTVFGSLPPRGALARIAWRLGVKLHLRNKAYGWVSKERFRIEVRRLQKWYKPGRRQTRRRRGIVRSAKSALQVRGRKSVITKAVRAHLRTLVSHRKLEGLWYWRQMAKALRVAGIPVHSGTVPVERLWSSLKDFFPKASRRMSLQWWNLLARLSYMRFNYRHFNHSVLPTFTDGDALLAERIENLVALTREMEACADGDESVLQGLRRTLE